MRMLKNKHINLYARYMEKPLSGEKPRDMSRLIPFVCVISLVVIFCVILLANQLTLNARKEELALLRSDMEDPLLVQEAEMAPEEELQAQLAERILESVQTDVSALTAQRASLERLSKELLLSVMDCGGGIRITGLSCSDGSLTVSAVAEKPEQIATYISQLEQSGHFSSIQYDGYQQQSGTYRFSLRAVIGR